MEYVGDTLFVIDVDVVDELLFVMDDGRIAWLSIALDAADDVTALVDDCDVTAANDVTIANNDCDDG